MLTNSHEKRTYSQVTVTRTMEHRRQSNKKRLYDLHVFEQTEPRVSQLNGDHATESGLTMHSSSALEKSGKQLRQEHSLFTVTRTMEHRRQSNKKKGSPTFTSLNKREPRVSQLNGDHATESGLTMHSSSALEKSGKQLRQEKLSFFLRGERWATARCRFRRTRMSRNTEVQDSGHSGDLIFG